MDVLLITIGGLFAAVATIVISLIANKAWITKFTLGGVLVWVMSYSVILLGYSLTSTEKVLATNEPKEYCGFYLDCHLSTVVTGVRQARSIGDMTANGEFYVVTVRVFSNAKNPSIGLHLIEPNGIVFDANGTSFARNASAESVLPTAEVHLGQSIWNSKPIEKEIVFDLPVDVKDPRLDISEGFGIDKVIEAVLIGDEDSILHKRTYFRLQEQNGTGRL
ncbi:MAG: hypothetical protein ABIV48_04265 [Pyrinomonadaceae bacterium]